MIAQWAAQPQCQFIFSWLFISQNYWAHTRPLLSAWWHTSRAHNFHIRRLEQFSKFHLLHWSTIFVKAYFRFSRLAGGVFECAHFVINQLDLFGCIYTWCIPMVRRSHLRFDVYPQGWFFTVLLRTPFLMDCTVRIAISVVLRVRASGSVENPSLCKLLHWIQDYRYGSCCSRFTSVGPINKDHRSVPTIRNRGNAGHRWPT